jgi:hypothetical protein
MTTPTPCSSAIAGEGRNEKRDAITAMIQTHNAPRTREEHLASAFFDKPQLYVPDSEEELAVPKWFRREVRAAIGTTNLKNPRGGVQ